MSVRNRPDPLITRIGWTRRASAVCHLDSGQPRPVRPRARYSPDHHCIASIKRSPQQGKSARKATPREAHADWVTRAHRRIPVLLIEAQNAGPAGASSLASPAHARAQPAPSFHPRPCGHHGGYLADFSMSGLMARIVAMADLSNFGWPGLHFHRQPAHRPCQRLRRRDGRGLRQWHSKRLAASFTIAGQYLDFSESGLCASDGPGRLLPSDRPWPVRRPGSSSTSGSKMIRVEDLQASAQISPAEGRSHPNRSRECLAETKLQALAEPPRWSMATTASAATLPPFSEISHSLRRRPVMEEKDAANWAFDTTTDPRRRPSPSHRPIHPDRYPGLKGGRRRSVDRYASRLVAEVETAHRSSSRRRGRPEKIRRRSRAPPSSEFATRPRPTHRRRPAPRPGRVRRLPRMDEGPDRGRRRLLPPPTPRLEGLVDVSRKRRRTPAAFHADLCGRILARAMRARAIGHGHQRLHR